MAWPELGFGAGLAVHRIPTSSWCGQLPVSPPRCCGSSSRDHRLSLGSLTTSETFPSSPANSILKPLVYCLASLSQALPGPFWKVEPFQRPTEDYPVSGI